VCGIAGFIAPGNQAAETRMLHALRHRGPDGAGSASLRHGEHTAGWFGHTRLAILDLSAAGRQPMCTEDGRFHIIHNGEIFNFRELRRKLEQTGERFTSQSDTEVILKAYRKWGEKCLEELRGMFAFAIWDAACGKLFLARDRLGIKPLYYHVRGGQLIFASEVRAVLACDMVPRRLNSAGIRSYLQFGSVCDPDTLIEGVTALLPGHYLVWQDGALRDVEYWDAPGTDPCRIPARHAEKPDRETVAELRGVLEETIRCSLVSDVPVGVFLSGGLDSSALVGLLSRSSPLPVSTFSIIFQEAEFNEAAHSRAVAAHFGTDHHEIIVRPREALAAISDAIHAMDQPTVDGINTYIVSREARLAGVKVALTGLGADEVFGGYSSFKTVPRMEQFLRTWERTPQLLRSGLCACMGKLAPRGDLYHKLDALIQTNGARLHPYHLSRALFVPKRIKPMLRAWGDTNNGSHECAQVPPQALQLDPVNRVSYLELRNYLANMLLRDADCMSMSQGLEVRVPFVDHKLVEFIFRLPGAFKVSAHGVKPLLVQAAADLLPEPIIRRLKQGFTLPFAHWMRGELHHEVHKVFARDVALLEEIMDLDSVRAVWREFLDARTSWTRPWALYVLLRWCALNL
jgi:asparagine synthase (glutamine-hydrolysing)